MLALCGRSVGGGIIMMVRVCRRGRYYYDGVGVSSGGGMIMIVRAYRRGRYYYDGVGVSSGEV